MPAVATQLKILAELLEEPENEKTINKDFEKSGLLLSSDKFNPKKFKQQLEACPKASWAPITHNFAKALTTIGPKAMTASLKVIFGSKIMSKPLVKALAQVASKSKILKFLGTTKGAVALAGVYLTYEAIMNISAWYHGKISGRRCAKNIIDASGALLGGYVGGGLGGTIGTAVFPGAGTVVGIVVGATIGTSIVGSITRSLTKTIFNLPADEALENAYRFFDLDQHASNEDINTAFLERCKTMHPDNGDGSPDNFMILQSNMQIIKCARGGC